MAELEMGMMNVLTAKMSKLDVPAKLPGDIEFEFKQFISLMYRTYRLRFTANCFIKINSNMELKASVNYRQIKQVVVTQDDKYIRIEFKPEASYMFNDNPISLLPIIGIFIIISFVVSIIVPSSSKPRRPMKQQTRASC